jgi:hypothetical protein
LEGFRQAACLGKVFVGGKFVADGQGEWASAFLLQLPKNVAGVVFPIPRRIINMQAGRLDEEQLGTTGRLVDE